MKYFNVSMYAASISVIFLMLSWSTVTSAKWNNGNKTCSNDQCQDYERCIDNKCWDVCDPYLFPKIAVRAICRGSNHEAHWSCRKGYIGNPFVECYKSCNTTINCERNERCYKGKCVSGRCKNGYIRHPYHGRCVYQPQYFHQTRMY